MVAKTFEEMVADAKEQCKTKPVNNLILKGILSFKETESKLIKSFEDVAAMWQKPKRPDSLMINHGEYIHRYGDGVEHVVQELKRKKDSNRACVSLIDMKDIIGSGDNAIPSFMILQFGYSNDDPKTLHATAYFRSLEVINFLPSNLAEIALIAKRLKIQFHDIANLDITILAFRAHANERFNCLRKCEIDAISHAKIFSAVFNNDIATIHKWIDEKLTCEETVITTSGLEQLLDAIKENEKKYSKEFVHNIDQALLHLRKLRDWRKVTSHSEEISALYSNVKECLKAAKTELK